MHLLLGNPAHAWNVFLACKEKEKSELFALNTCLWPAAWKLFKDKWRKLATASLLLQYVDENSCLGWRNVLSGCVLGFRLNFAPIALLRKRFQLDSKADLVTEGPIFGFFWLNYGFFRWILFCMDWNLPALLKIVSFLTTSSLFDN